MDQPGKVVSPARGQLNREECIFSCPRSRLRIWSRETGSAVPLCVSLLILYIQAETGIRKAVGTFYNNEYKISTFSGGFV